MAPSRETKRRVHLYDLKDPPTVLGGLENISGVTNNNLYAMVEIIFVFQDEFSLQNEAQETVPKDGSPLQPGNYYVQCNTAFELNNEPLCTRTMSLSTGKRVAHFAKAIRERDRQCVISGLPVPQALNGDLVLTGFHAAHIFPLSHEGDWIQYDYGRWITLPSPSGGTINSVQNGMLLFSYFHQLFDTYQISINPDDNYKVVAFNVLTIDCTGRHLDQSLLARPDAPAPELLRWHYRQSVLANVKGAGEPEFETDFPAGSDIMGCILAGPKAAERMEAELFGRFGAQMELFSTPLGLRAGGWEDDDEGEGDGEDEGEDEDGEKEDHKEEHEDY